MEHTPGLLRVSPVDARLITDSEGTPLAVTIGSGVTATAQSHANAEYIVRAWNSHEDLLTACEELHRILSLDEGYNP